MPRHIPFVCIQIFALMAATSGFVSGHAHTSHIHAAGSGPVAPAGVIDGRLHPELISDQDAITVFWISIMEPPDSDPLAHNRCDANILKMNRSATLSKDHQE